MYRHFLKRVFDVAGAAVLLLAASPLIIATIVILAAAQRGRVFFFQTRPGRDGKPFTIYKFKTMNDKRDSRGELLPDALRLTAAGRLVRRASLDELLQLINVLKGDMSLVGPRPLLLEYLPLYTAYQKQRHDVRPGITGLAQVKGRNAASWRRRFCYDVFYTKHVSVALDLKILLLTVVAAIKGTGIMGPSGNPIEKYAGPPSREDAV